jgi:hypothetical protein
MSRRRVVVGAVALLALGALAGALVARNLPQRRSPVTSLASVASQDTGEASDIVHATATGKRYHRAGCRSLSRSDIPMTRAEAEQRGLTPCKVCKP